MRVGVVGAGGMGSVHARKYALMDDVDLYAFDRNQEKLDNYCTQFGATGAKSLEALIETVDAVDVCTPTDSHFEIAMAAVKAGKAVLVEKPMCRTVQECRDLIDAAKTAGVGLMPGQVVRYFGDFEAVHEAVKAGKVGKPAVVRSRRGGRAARGSDLWFQDHERSGGVLLDLAVHDFDWLTWTFGDVKTVHSRTICLGDRVEGAEFEGDYALTTLTFASGCIAHVETTWMDPTGFRATIEVCGSEGMIEHDTRNAATLRIHTADGSRQEANLAPSDDPFFRQLRAFVDAVEKGGAMPVDPEDGLRAVEIAWKAIESAKTGRAIAL